MEWDAYYKKFDEWATSTQISRLSALTSYGPSDEVAEVAQGLMDEMAASRLIRRALAAGVQFTAEEICELVDCCNAAVMNALLENSLCTFTREQLEDLWGAVDDAVLEQTARRCRVKLFDDDEEEEEADDESEPAELHRRLCTLSAALRLSLRPLVLWSRPCLRLRIWRKPRRRL